LNSLTSYINGKIVFKLFILVMCLLLSGMLLQEKISTLLNAALETAIARQTADMSVAAEERFHRELAELEFAARYIEAHPSAETEENILAELGHIGPGVSVGMMQPNEKNIHLFPKRIFCAFPLRSAATNWWTIA